MALSDFLSRHGVSRTASASEAMAGAEEALEVAAGAAGIGFLEQRYGEQKTTLFMTPQTDAAGNVVKDGNGKTQYQSGTGVPLSAAIAVGGFALAALVPMTPGWRRRVANLSSGAGAAFGYRKGVEWGQKALDAKQPAPQPQTQKPVPPFAQSASALAEQANVKGEMGEGGTVHDFVARANDILAQRARAANGR